MKFIIKQTPYGLWNEIWYFTSFVDKALDEIGYFIYIFTSAYSTCGKGNEGHGGRGEQQPPSFIESNGCFTRKWYSFQQQKLPANVAKLHFQRKILGFFSLWS